MNTAETITAPDFKPYYSIIIETAFNIPDFKIYSNAMIVETAQQQNKQTLINGIELRNQKSPRNCGYFIFDNNVQSICCKTQQHLQQMILGNLNVNTQKNKTKSLLLTLHIIQPQMDKRLQDLNSYTVKFLFIGRTLRNILLMQSVISVGFFSS